MSHALNTHRKASPLLRNIVGGSALVLIGLVAVWVARNAWNEHQQTTDRNNIENLNRLVLMYQKQFGRVPDLNLIELYRQGMTRRRLHQTPFGGFYRFDPKQSVVYNPNRLSP